MPRFRDGNLPAREQMRQIEAIQPPSIEEVRRKYLEPLKRQLGWK